MKTIFTLGIVLMLLPLSGCITGAVIQEARNGDRTYEVTDPKTGDTTTHPAHPWSNYLLLPITIPADIVTSPIQALFLLLMWGKC